MNANCCASLHVNVQVDLNREPRVVQILLRCARSLPTYAQFCWQSAQTVVTTFVPVSPLSVQYSKLFMVCMVCTVCSVYYTQHTHTQRI